MTASESSGKGQQGAGKGAAGGVPTDEEADWREQLSRLISAWRECEKLLKQAERIGGDAIIPTINQLRYAGTHHIDWLENHDSSALRSAVAHCHRGSYDALEVTLLVNLDRGRFILNQLDQASVDSSEINVSGFDEYKLRDAIADIEDLSRERKKDVSARDNESIVVPDLDRDYFELAKTKRDELLSAMRRAPDVLKQLKKKEDRLARAEFNTKAVIVIYILTAIAAVLGLYWRK